MQGECRVAQRIEEGPRRGKAHFVGAAPGAGGEGPPGKPRPPETLFRRASSLACLSAEGRKQGCLPHAKASKAACPTGGPPFFASPLYYLNSLRCPARSMRARC